MSPRHTLDKSQQPWSEACNALAERLLLAAERHTMHEARTTERFAGLEGRIATMEARIAGLSIVEQLKAMQHLLQEQFAQFEWLAKRHVSLRGLLQNVGDDLKPEPDPLAGALPTMKDVGAALAGVEVSDDPGDDIGKVLSKLGLKL